MADDPGLFAAPATEERQVATRGASEGRRSIRYITAAVLEYGKVRGLDDLLDRVGRLCWSTGYAPYNALLILLQRPGATHVLPAHRWAADHGRVPRPGEQPLVLLQRGGPLMFLLDVSQTEEGEGARALPLELADPYAMPHAPGAPAALHWLVQNSVADGVRVTPSPLGRPFAGCVEPTRGAAVQRALVRVRPRTEVDVPVRYDVELNRSASPTEQLATLAHELGHLWCGHLGAHPDGLWGSRTGHPEAIRELEAESVARVVFRALFPGVALPDHLSQYFEREPDLARADLEAVLRAAGRVLEMARGFAPHPAPAGA